MDAGARGRRLLQRREYKAKVSEFVPKELEDHVVYENPNTNLFPDGTQEKVKKFLDKGTEIMNSNKILRTIGNVFKSKNSGKNYPTKQEYQNQINKNSYEPEGEMIEANSEQMKAMHDAKMKKMEDDKVAEKKKKKMDEACWKGYEKKGMKTMFGKRYPNCVKKTKKEEVEIVEDMKGMSQKSGDKRSTESGAGMTAKGVAKYNRRTGGNLKTAVTTPPSKLKAGSKAAKRRKSFCARSKSWDGPRGKAARRRWNCSYEPELPMIIDEKKKLFNTSPLSTRVTNWSKKINEGDSYVKSDRNKFGLPKDLKSTEKKSDKKTTGVNYTAMAQSYVPQGEMIERKMTSSEKDKKEKYVKGMKKDKAGFTKRYGKDGKSVMYATATKMAMKEESCGKGEYYCYDDKKCKPIPDGMKVGKDGMLVKEAKYEKGASDYGKTSIRNKRAFGKGGNARPPEERGAAKMLRHDSHTKRRGVKKNNKYGATNKPPVYGAPSDEFKKNKNVKENFIKDLINNAKNTVNKYNKKLQQNNDAINKVMPGSAGFEKKPIKLEGSLHKWFKGSKSKDGKPGWVNVVTGGTCASDKKGEGTPKCVSSSKRASMSKAERLSASRRKKKADPGQQSKSGAAKPTYVATDSKKKK